MECKSLETLQAFKTEFLTKFEGTDEGAVTHNIPGKILQWYWEWDKPAVKMQREAGVQLSKADSPELVDPELHQLYWGIMGHLVLPGASQGCRMAVAILA
eukprot:1889392-Rhodomonas_salina.3